MAMIGLANTTNKLVKCGFALEFSTDFTKDF